MFGGSGPSWPPLAETWLFDGTDWTPGPPAPAGLTGRVGAGMAYFPDIGKVVLVGGSGSNVPSDTWLYDGVAEAWTPGPALPPAMGSRVFFGITYDPRLHQMVVAGGSGKRDVWFFDGTAWSEGPSLPSSAGARERTRLAFHPYLGGDVLWGGLGPGSAKSTLYLLKGGAWSQVTVHPNPIPKARLDAALLWNSAAKMFMVFGGVADSDNGTHALSDTWSLVAPPLSVSPTSGPVGTSVSITSGPGWVAGSAVQVRFQKQILQTYTVPGTGVVDTTVSVPQASLGAKTFKLLDTVRALVVSSAFTVTGSRTRSSFADSAFSGSQDPTTSPVAGARVGRHGATLNTRRSLPSSTSAGASGQGQIMAHDGQFWTGSQPILLHGLNASPFGSIFHDLDDDDFATMASWNMNVARLWVHWADFEPTPPVRDGTAWVHTYKSSKMDRLKAEVDAAYRNGISVVLMNYCGPPCYGNGWPDWLYESPYNSHGRGYTDSETAATDFWSDPLQKQFTRDWLGWLAGQLNGTPGVVGYEVLNEPNPGLLPAVHSTTQLILDTQLQLAQTVRAADPARVVFFMTRQATAAGLPQADLSEWRALGNVALDAHGYFGGRWGPGLNMDTTNPNYGEILEDIFDFTLTPDVPPYLGTTFGQRRYCETLQSSLGGIPLLFGEFGGRTTLDPNIDTVFGTMANGFNACGASWTAMSYTGSNDVWKGDGTPQPWLPILAEAASFTGQ
jgi:aryl-phospho-beta-D-glucosidase BglC (GH1 family)